MTIKFKLALIPIVGLFLIIVLVDTYWIPLQLEKAKRDYEEHTYELIAIGETGITQNLLTRDLGSLYSSIEYLETVYETRWKHFTVYNHDNKRIYPIIPHDPELPIGNDAFIHIVFPLDASGANLGRVEFYADWAQERKKFMDSMDGIRNFVIFLTVISIALGILSQHLMIYSALKRLVKATQGIAQGNFKITLPAASKDEIGELVHAFHLMKEELSFQKKALDEHAIVSMTDRGGVITYVNKKFVDVSGYQSEELIGKTHRIIKSNRHSPQFYKKCGVLFQVVIPGMARFVT